MFFRRSSRGRPDATPQPAGLPEPLAIDAISPFLRSHLGLPHLNWDEALDHIDSTTQTDSDADELAHAMIAGWVDFLAQTLQSKYRTPLERWRSIGVEGLAPKADRMRLERAAASSLATIGRALTPILGDPNEHPIAHITIIAAPTMDAYYDLVDAYRQDDGHVASSGGIYLGDSSINPSTLILNVDRHAFEHSIAHELTHHALAPRSEDAGDLPLWAEEGLTQMMEERVTNQCFFTIDHEKMRRHRALWSSIGLAGFLHGDTFRSPEDGHQELSYNLAEAVTRSLLDTRPAEFFAFARACLHGQSASAAAMEHLCQSEEAIMLRFLGLDTHK
ncbi:MAG: hypothetical protein RIE32_08140 [Phycisphaerales bacterium]